MDKKQELWKVFSISLRRILTSMNIEFEKLQEIRLRVWEPLIVIYDNREFFVGENGKLNTCMNDTYTVTPEDIRNTLDFISHYSLSFLLIPLLGICILYPIRVYVNTHSKIVNLDFPKGFFS